MQGEHTIGRHLVRLEGDVVFIRQAGEVTREEWQAICNVFEGVLSKQPQTYALFDISEGVPFGPELRKHSSEWGKRWQFAGVAFCGASLILRSVISLVMHAVALFRPGRVAPIVYLKNVQEGRAWIAEQRKKARPAGPDSTGWGA